MTRTESEQQYLTASESYMSAIRPTSQQTQAFYAATVQMIADREGGQVVLALPIGLRVVREPTRRKYGT
ncbi:hypothetical protein [Paraburkholderia atlantica]|uniref:hypothetical protein n=1 Tax=Paraburkholderia atlantica TaxID=2654982 RepID=UPI00181385D5|nr:hypothetical protein [Paraburkholderia atlantica]MBB5508095.1 hypothetical protein [Paraburkholderia atlantica]